MESFFFHQALQAYYLFLELVDEDQDLSLVAKDFPVCNSNFLSVRNGLASGFSPGISERWLSLGAGGCE